MTKTPKSAAPKQPQAAPVETAALSKVAGKRDKKGRDIGRAHVVAWRDGRAIATAEKGLFALKVELERTPSDEALRKRVAEAAAELTSLRAADARRRRARKVASSIANMVARVHEQAKSKTSKWTAERRQERKAIRARTEQLRKRGEPKAPKPRAGVVVTTLRGVYVEIDSDDSKRRKALATVPVEPGPELKLDAEGWRIDQETPARLIEAPAPARWTPAYVRSTLVQAFRILDRTPMSIWPKSKGASWISYIYETGDLVAQASSGTINRGAPKRTKGGFSLGEIRACNEALQWQLRYLRDDSDAARAVGLDALWEAREQNIAEELDYLDPPISARSFFRWKDRGYNTIAACLNRDGVPAF